MQTIRIKMVHLEDSFESGRSVFELWKSVLITTTGADDRLLSVETATILQTSPKLKGERKLWHQVPNEISDIPVALRVCAEENAPNLYDCANNLIVDGLIVKGRDYLEENLPF